jgi:5-(aminomethyl)-3-furanmethanol phosphate kinase
LNQKCTYERDKRINNKRAMPHRPRPEAGGARRATGNGTCDERHLARAKQDRAVLMWVVKVSGSLNRDPLLPLWLELMAQLGGGRVTIVCGGGNFAEEARHAHAHWRFDNSLHAHNMAVLATAQAGYLALCLEPRLRLAASEASIRQILRAGHTAVWLPLELLRDQPGADTSGGVASDRIALDLAGRLNAEHLVLVKSGVVDPTASVSELSRAGVLHRCFESITKRVGFPIDVVHSSDLTRMRSLLHGDIKPTIA